MADSEAPSGLKKGLTNYGDIEFSLFLRRAFIKGAAYTDERLARPVVGLANRTNRLANAYKVPVDEAFRQAE